ncbi:Acyl-CoA dehydrogenase [Sesbania bispinosa]|nr:Acyl-CoA dehydrogenase [Sesbania bispinosa]
MSSLWNGIISNFPVVRFKLNSSSPSQFLPLCQHLPLAFKQQPQARVGFLLTSAELPSHISPQQDTYTSQNEYPFSSKGKKLQLKTVDTAVDEGTPNPQVGKHDLDGVGWPADASLAERGSNSRELLEEGVVVGQSVI